RLVEVAVQHGARAGYLVDFAHEIDESWLDGAATVGVSSGASVPDNLVQEVLVYLAERGYGEVEEVEPVRETITFQLPRELVRDLRAAENRA
ncbi:MAG TPA: 4-hydroxy-3-methylbut-2-enyl diphosphate reductase, partial [Glycomyces sp.]|nr:4-hydroxy-3-methylbut-2-enyl diphosphate reductase [Glycomyces sp.]